MDDDDLKLLGSVLGLLLTLAALWGIHVWMAHLPCSDFANVTYRYAPLRCLPH